MGLSGEGAAHSLAIQDSPMSKDGNKVIGINEIAHELGCSQRTVRRYHATGKIRSFKLGGVTSPIKMRRVDLRKAPKGDK